MRVTQARPTARRRRGGDGVIPTLIRDTIIAALVVVAFAAVLLINLTTGGVR